MDLRRKKTFLWYFISMSFDQSWGEVIKVETTAISTPLDNVPLYMVHPS